MVHNKATEPCLVLKATLSHHMMEPNTIAQQSPAKDSCQATYCHLACFDRGAEDHETGGQVDLQGSRRLRDSFIVWQC